MPKEDRYVDLEAGAIKGTFRDGLCHCFSDLGSCCCAFWGCQVCLLGQLYEKMVGFRFSCCAVVFVYYGLILGGAALFYRGNGQHTAALFWAQVEGGAADQSAYERAMSFNGPAFMAEQGKLPLLMLGCAVLCVVASFWWFTCLTARVYAHFRERYGIQDTLRINVCGCCLDLCCAYNFSCCILTQMARHLGPDVFPTCSCVPAPGGFWLWDQSSWPEKLVKRRPTLLSRHSPQEEKKEPESRHSPRGEGHRKHSPRHLAPPPQHHKHRHTAEEDDWPEDNHPVKM
jgi:hypothetical protein